nr:MAG TPA: hypothetical protein [Bacteriophage sp.]
MYLLPSDQMNRVACNILKYALPCKTKITCKLYSSENEDVVVDVTQINSFSVNQTFEINFMDATTISVALSIQEALLILRNYKDIHCALTLTRVDKIYLYPITELQPFEYDFLVIIDNAEDLLKELSKAELTAKATDDDKSNADDMDRILGRKIEIVMQLVTQEEHDLRLSQMNAILNNTTIENAIYFVANTLNIKNVNLYPPDNQKVYSTITLPPMQNIATVFDFMQERYGIYAKGLEYYFTQGTLYIYPGLETNPETETKKILHIYNVPKNNYEGSDGYYAYDAEDNIHLLCNQDTRIVNNAQKSTENTGSNFVALRNDTAIDLTRTTKGNNGEFSDQNLLLVGTENNKTAISNSVNNRYIGGTNNVLALTSELARNNVVLLESGWAMAMPYILTPGMKVIYHYDDINEYKTVNGILCGVQCTIYPLENNKEFVYAGGGLLTCRLEPNEEQDSLTTDASEERMAGLDNTLSDTVQDLIKTSTTSITDVDVTTITEKQNISTTTAGTTTAKPGTVEFDSTESKDDFINSLKDTTELKDATVKSIKDSSVSNETSKNLFEDYKSLSEKIKDQQEYNKNSSNSKNESTDEDEDDDDFYYHTVLGYPRPRKR